MPASWKGYIRLSLVSVPVEGFNAIDSGETISFNQLHEECGNRIRYKKVCEVHGEVTHDEIVMGYQFAKDQYAVIDPDEIEQLRSERDRSINVDRFVDPSQIDPVYFAGQTYYLMPNGKAGEKPYALLHKAMVDADVCGLAQVVLMNREQLVALRPVGKLLAISVLNHHADLKPREQYESLVGDADVPSEELKLAKSLIGATLADGAGLEDFHDLRNERMRKFIESKIAGKEVVTSPTAKAGPPVIDMMAALRASLTERKANAGRKKRAPGRHAASKKRKTG